MHHSREKFIAPLINHRNRYEEYIRICTFFRLFWQATQVRNSDCLLTISNVNIKDRITFEMYPPLHITFSFLADIEEIDNKAFQVI